uniref:Uncharacterized protein n=1 Tax=Arundo donax TaxID=35708 RepID=A0A0A9DDP0_ARUDO
MLVKRRPSWLALSKKPSYHNFILHHGKKSAADLCLCMLMHPRQGLLAFLLMMTVPHVRINKGLPVLLLMMAVPRVDRQVTIDEPHPAHPRLTPLVTAEARRNRRASMRPGRPTGGLLCH